jgi:transcriptional regulator with XRE-family HTH domain
MTNRLFTLMKQRGFTYEALAQKTNSSKSSIHDVISGKTKLNTDWIMKLAKALDVSEAEIFEASGVSRETIEDDVVLVTEGADAAGLTKTAKGDLLYRVVQDRLDQIGIVSGMTLLVETNPETVASLESEEIVIAQLHWRARTITLLRQYIAPSLLITNSSARNADILNLRTDDVGITGIVIQAQINRRRKM